MGDKRSSGHGDSKEAPEQKGKGRPGQYKSRLATHTGHWDLSERREGMGGSWVVEWPNSAE